MKSKILLIASAICLAACSAVELPVMAGTHPISPSAPPAILTPTPVFLPSPTDAAISPTVGPTSSPSPLTSTSPTPSRTDEASPGGASGFVLQILACNTSLDLIHQMGEVTNAYPLLINKTDGDLTGICATLSASDEDRAHPDKKGCISSLPSGYQVLLKLTVDTGFKQDTAIRVDAASSQGLTASASASSCSALGYPGKSPENIGVVQPIP
jgi:hypothetical protein